MLDPRDSIGEEECADHLRYYHLPELFKEEGKRVKTDEAWEEMKDWLTMHLEDTFYQDELLDKMEELELKHE